MADPETEHFGSRLRRLVVTPANKVSEYDTASGRRCNIIIVPGASPTAPDASTASKVPKGRAWPWLNDGEDGPAAQLASFLSLRTMHSRTYVFEYSVPMRREGITTSTIENLAHALLDSIGKIQSATDVVDSLDGVDDYEEEGSISNDPPDGDNEGDAGNDATEPNSENADAGGQDDKDDKVDGTRDTEEDLEDDTSNSESESESTGNEASGDECFVFIAQDLGGLVVKKALSAARTTIGPYYQFIASRTTLLLFYETPGPSSLHESSWESIANGLLCTSNQSMLFSSAWIQNTARMVESVCADFALSEPIYHVLNIRCSAIYLVPSLRQNPVYTTESTAALMSVGEMLLKLMRTPLCYMRTLSTLALTLNDLPRLSTTTVVPDALRRARMEALRKEPGVSQWTTERVSSGFAGFIVPSQDDASVLFEVLLKDASAANSSNHLWHLDALDELAPTDLGEKRNNNTKAASMAETKANPVVVISYAFDPYNREANTATALLASLCYQLICLRRDAFAHASELANYLIERAKERVWPLDKLLALFRAILSCPHEGTVACVLWEMPGTVFPPGLVSTLADLISGMRSEFKLAVISSRADPEFPSVPKTPKAHANLPAFPTLLSPGRGLLRAPTWAAGDAHVFRLMSHSIDLAGIVDRELASLLGRRPEMKSVQQQLKDIILAGGASADRASEIASHSSRNGRNSSKKSAALFGGSHAEVAASVRAWLELITRRAAPITFASIAREAPNMPTTMADLYLATLSYAPPYLLPTVQQLLAWLSLSRRPMTLAELAVALAVVYTPSTGHNSGVGSLIHARTMREVDDHKPVNVQADLLSFLGSAVQFDDAGRPLLQAELIDLLRLEHSTVHDDDDGYPFLKYVLPDAHDTLARICLSFLRICQSAYPRVEPATIKSEPFCEYAVLHWPYHHATSRELHRSTPNSPAQRPPASSFEEYFGDADLMKFWAELYHSLRHPGLNPPKANITLSMAADVGCCDLIRHVLQYITVGKTPATSQCTTDHKGTTASRAALSRALLYAIQYGDLDTIKLLEADGAQSRYSIHVAIASNQNALLGHFGPLSDALDIKDWRGYTPTQIAAATGNVCALDALLKADADVKISDDEEFIYQTATEVFTSVESTYMDVYYQPFGLSALHIACMFGHVTAVKRILEEETVNPNGFDTYSNRPIYYACMLQHPETLRALLGDRRTDPTLIADAYGCQTPIQIAALNGRVDMIELLLDSVKLRLQENTSASPMDALRDHLRCGDRFGLTALQVAAIQGHVSTGKALLSHDASSELALQTTGPADSISLHLAAQYDRTEFMELLLGSGDAVAQLSQKRTDELAQTALHISAQRANFASSMRVLVDAHVKADLSLDVSDSDTTTALHYAAWRGSVANARLLLDSGAAIDAVNGKSATPLLLACKKGFVDVVRLLLEKNADLGISTGAGLTPLLAAAWSGSVPTIKAVLDTAEATSLQEADQLGRNVLHYAALSSSYEALIFVLQTMGQTLPSARRLHSTVEKSDSTGEQILLDCGQLLLQEAGGLMVIEAAAQSTFLHQLWTAVKGHAEDKDALHGRLLRRVADVGHFREFKKLVGENDRTLDAKDANGMTALSFAARRGHIGLVRFLAGRTKPSQDNTGYTPLMYAIIKGHTKVVEILLSRGHEAEVEMLTPNNESPLYFAVRYSNSDIVRLLLKYKADANTVEETDQNTALHCAVMYASVEVVDLIAHAPGVQGNARNSDDRTPMCLAAYFNLSDEAHVLLKAGWKGSSEDSYRHRTPLHDSYGNGNMIRLFVDEVGVDINAPDNKGQTALHLACGSYYGEVLLLLQLGADPMIVNDDNETSLHVAVAIRETGIFLALLQSKFVPSLSELKNLKSNSGDNIFDVAAKHNNTGVLAYLLDAEDSPFQAVEQSIDGAKALQYAFKNNTRDIIRILLDRAQECVSQLPDEMKRKHIDILLEAICSSTTMNADDIDRAADEVIRIYLGPQDGGALASREAWPYILFLQCLMKSDNNEMHQRRAFPQLTRGIWAEIRDHNGWTYPQLLETMVPLMSDKKDAESTLPTDEPPTAETRLRYGLEKVVLTEEDRAMFSNRPDTPKFPTSWSPAASHPGLIWHRQPASAASSTSDKTVQEADSGEVPTNPDSKSASILYACASPSWDYPERAAAALSDYPIPPNSRFFFSIQVVCEGDENLLAAGVAYGCHPVHSLPGWEAVGWGFHGDDGGYFHEDINFLREGDVETYGTDDIVGVYVDTAAHRVFYSINGRILANGFENVYGRLYPIVGMSYNASIEATFGSPDGDAAFFDDEGEPLMNKVTNWL